MKKSISTFLALVLIFLSSSLTFVKASPDSIKDNGTAIESPELNDTELENLDDFIEEQLINISGAGKYKGMVIWDNGTEKVYSITKNAEKIGWYVLDENGIISKYNQELDKELFNNMSIDEKITPELSELLDVEHDDLKHIYVWLKDIDTEKVYNQIPAIFSADNQQDISTIQTYINSQRTCYKEAYLKYNKDFLLS